MMITVSVLILIVSFARYFRICRHQSFQWWRYEKMMKNKMIEDVDDVSYYCRVLQYPTTVTQSFNMVGLQLDWILYSLKSYVWSWEVSVINLPSLCDSSSDQERLLNVVLNVSSRCINLTSSHSYVIGHVTLLNPLWIVDSMSIV